MSLDKVLAYAAAQGKSLVALTLLPDGFFSWPEASREERMGAVLAFAREDDAVELAFGGELQKWGHGPRHVRTQAGVNIYKVPIGTLITARMRKAAQGVHGAEKEAGQFDKEGAASAKAGAQGAAKAGQGAAQKAAGGAAKTVARAAASDGKAKLGTDAKAARAGGKAAQDMGGGAEPQHPDAVGGHKVLGVYTHPETKRAMYDLGHGLHAEGEAGKKPGGVMRSNTGLQRGAMADKGWKFARPPKAPAGAKPGEGGAGKPKSALEKVAGVRPGDASGTKPKGTTLGDKQKAWVQSQGGKGFDPANWEQDWAPPYRGMHVPDLQPAQGFKDLRSSGREDGSGTAEDPIDVKGNLEKALDLMNQGKHVRLNQPTEITLLMQKVRQLTQASEAAKNGEKPDWDFGLLTVRGTNLFAAQHKGIPRVDMPQFSGLASEGSPAAKMAGGAGKFIDLGDEFGKQLQRDGVKVTPKTVRVATLRATQTELSGAKVAGFAAAVLRGDPKASKAMEERIYVTRDGYVIDGHHRWAANMLVDAVDGKLGNDTDQNVSMVDMDIGAAIPYSNDFAQRMGIAGRARGK